MIFRIFNEVIARKSLGASYIWITLLAMAMPVANFTSIWWARFLLGRNQQTILLINGFLIFLALSSGFFLSTPIHLFLMFFSCALLNSIIDPAQNRILQHNVAPKQTGKIFSWATSLRFITMAFGAALAGRYMKNVQEGYQYLYPVSGIIFFLGVWSLSSLPVKENTSEKRQPFNKTLILDPLKKVVKLLKKRKDFLRFETAFMLYGIAFLMSLPVFPVYLIDDLGFDYKAIGQTKGTMFFLTMAVGVLIFGRLFDKSTPHRMGAQIFLMLALFPILLVTAGHLHGQWRTIIVYTDFAIFGFAMSGVVILWTLSSLRFADKEDAGIYHSVHVAATGIRGSVAPLLGYLTMNLLGKEWALLCSSLLWMIASLLMILMRLWDIKAGEKQSLRAK